MGKDKISKIKEEIHTNQGNKIRMMREGLITEDIRIKGIKIRKIKTRIMISNNFI